jgi:exonuclease III
VEDFKNPTLSNGQVIQTETKQKKKMELTDVMTQMNLTDIYRTLPPNTKEYTFLSAPHGITLTIYLVTKQTLTDTRKLK